MSLFIRDREAVVEAIGVVAVVLEIVERNAVVPVVPLAVVGVLVVTFVVLTEFRSVVAAHTDFGARVVVVVVDLAVVNSMVVLVVLVVEGRVEGMFLVVVVVVVVGLAAALFRLLFFFFLPLAGAVGLASSSAHESSPANGVGSDSSSQADFRSRFALVDRIGSETGLLRSHV